MPQTKTQLEGDAPDGPHLAVLVSEFGEWMAIPPRATIAIIEDPSRADKIYPMVVAKVSLKKIITVCKCGDPNCNVNYHWTLTRTGHHRPVKRAAAYSSDEQEPNAKAAPSPTKGSR